MDLTEAEIEEYNKRNPNYPFVVVNGELKSQVNTSKFEENEKKRLVKLYEKANIPLRYIGLELKSLKIDPVIIKKAESYINMFEPKSFHNIYFEGNHTAGKSSLMCAITKELIQKGYKGYFIYAGELSHKLQEKHSYGNNTEVKDFLKWTTTLDFLAIDDIFSPEKDVGFNRSNLISQWDIYLRSLIDNGMGIMTTSNTPLDKIKDEYGLSLHELFNRDFGLKISFKNNIKDALKTQRQNELINKAQGMSGGHLVT